MRKILPAFLMVAFIFISVSASANFILGNASKYNLYITCGEHNYNMAVGGSPVTIPYNPKQKKYSIAFSYFNSADSQLVFKGTFIGHLVCASKDVKSCVGTINLDKKPLADFIEVYKQNKNGDIHIVFDDLPSPKTK